MSDLSNYIKSYYEKGLMVIPLDGKIPKVKWTKFQNERPSLEDVYKLFDPNDTNIGIITGPISKIVVVDCDDEKSYEWALANLPPTPMVTKTSRGYHLYYRHLGEKVKTATNLNGIKIDIRGDGGVIVAPPSIHPNTNEAYKEVSSFYNIEISELPPFSSSWFQQSELKENEHKISNANEAIKDDILHTKILEYIEEIHPAIEGQNGDKETFKVAYKLINGLDLSIEKALYYFKIFNDKCQPPWNEKQLFHKLKSAKDHIDVQTKGDFKYQLLMSDNFFEVNSKGIHIKEINEGNDGQPKVTKKFICSPIYIKAKTRDDDSSNWGFYISFKDMDNKLHEFALPSEIIYANPTDVISVFANRGLHMLAKKGIKEAIIHYIISRRVKERMLCVSRVGWHNNDFVLPNKIFTKSTQKLVFQSKSTTQHKFNEKGTLPEWQNNIGQYCKDNSRLALAIGIAFAGPLLYLNDTESGGFHFRGTSSSGKTTALRVAGSVYGGSTSNQNGFVEQWRATSNGLESIAMGHCDTILLLDELSQVNPKEAGAIAYMLANGTGKHRANRDGNVKKSAEWRILFLSSGEISLEDHMNEGNHKIKAGQETRMIDIAADAENDLGAFDTIYDFETPAQFADHLKEASNKFYGTAINEYMDNIINNIEFTKLFIKEKIKHFEKTTNDPNHSGQIKRVIKRFALVYAAIELATHFKILSWVEDEGLKATQQCLSSWLSQRDGVNNLEEQKALEQIKEILQSQQTRFNKIDFLDLDPKTSRKGITKNDAHNCLGFIDLCEEKFLIFPPKFKKELCKGFDHKMIAKMLFEKNLLDHNESNYKTGKTTRLPNEKNQRLYHIKAHIIEELGTTKTVDTNDNVDTIPLIQ